MEKNSRIYVAGHTGLVGSAVVRELERKGYKNILTAGHKAPPFACLDDAEKVEILFDLLKPEYVFLCAAHAGGIKEAIDHPVEMLSDNLLIQTNVINACHEFGVKKLLNFGSSCMYPVDGKQPYKEEQLGTGKTDENWSYALAKLAGVELCRAYNHQYGCNFISAIPCNLYGLGDRFDAYGHVIPSLIRKFHEQDSVSVWGNPETKREFLHADDLATMCVTLMEGYCSEDLYDGIINVGSGVETSMLDLVETIKGIVKPDAAYAFDGSNAGVPSKLMDSSNSYYTLMWEPKTSLEDGIRGVYEWYKSNRP